jgi:hypothetical protein
MEAAPAQRGKVLEYVSSLLGVPVARWVRYGDEESGRYELILADGRRVQAGTVKETLSVPEFNARWFAITGVFVPAETRKKRWQRLHEQLARVIEIEDADVSEIEETLEMVADAMSQQGAILDVDRKAVNPDERRRAIEIGQTIIEKGVVYVRQLTIEEHLSTHALRCPNLRARLQRAGFRRKTLQLRIDKVRVTSRYYWCREAWESAPSGLAGGQK